MGLQITIPLSYGRGTTAGDTFNLSKLPEKYHFVLLVKLEGEGNNIFLDRTEIFLLTKEEITKSIYSINELADKIISQDIIDRTFQ